MRSTGNDIVALRAGDKKRTGQFRFFSKILSGSEQALYHEPQFTGMPFEHYVWLLWSVKESVYKYLKRSIHHLEFSPTGIVIQSIEIPVMTLMPALECIHREDTGNAEEFYRGKVIYGPHILYFRSQISKGWIATVVNEDENFCNVYWGVQSIGNSGYYHQSKAAKKILLNKLNSFFGDELQVKKTAVGYPIILKGMQNMHIPVSLAHDDRFVAYSFKLNSLMQPY